MWSATIASTSVSAALASFVVVSRKYAARTSSGKCRNSVSAAAGSAIAGEMGADDCISKQNGAHSRLRRHGRGRQRQLNGGGRLHARKPRAPSFAQFESKPQTNQSRDAH